jgi:hypothetical protein
VSGETEISRRSFLFVEGDDGRGKFAEGDVAAFLATTAGFRANGAMLVTDGVDRTGVAASLTRNRASMQLRVEHGLGTWMTQQQRNRGRANCGAFLLQARAFLESVRVNLAQCSVGSYDTNLLAERKGVDGIDDRPEV